MRKDSRLSVRMQWNGFNKKVKVMNDITQNIVEYIDYHHVMKGRTTNMARKLKIGITCYPTLGGSGVVATELGKLMAERGHEIHFITHSIPFRLGKFHKTFSFMK